MTAQATGRGTRLARQPENAATVLSAPREGSTEADDDARDMPSFPGLFMIEPELTTS